MTELNCGSGGATMTTSDVVVEDMHSNGKAMYE